MFESSFNFLCCIKCFSYFRVSTYPTDCMSAHRSGIKMHGGFVATPLGTLTSDQTLVYSIVAKEHTYSDTPYSIVIVMGRGVTSDRCARYLSVYRNARGPTSGSSMTMILS